MDSCAEAQDVDPFLAERERDLRERAEAGDAEGCYELAELLVEKRRNDDFVRVVFEYGEGQLDEIRELYRSAADAGHVAAQYRLGRMHYDGSYGAPQDYKEAFRRFQRAADDGHQEAQYTLFLMHRDGVGAPQNFVRAHLWLNLCRASWGSTVDNWPPLIRAEALKALGKTASAAITQLEEKMIPEEIAEARRLATVWWEKYAGN